MKKAPHSEESIDYAAMEMKEEEVNDYDEKAKEKKETHD